MAACFARSSLFLFAFGLFVPAESVQAADVAGAWRLNYPFDDFNWVFTQANPSRFSAESNTFILVEFPAQCLMTGRTSGARFSGVTYLTYLDVLLPTGFVNGRVVGNQMDGVVVDFLFGVYQLDGQRVLGNDAVRVTAGDGS